MLLGRERERRALAAVLDIARSGSSAALVLSGEPGIGKTALLDDAAARADGMRLLRVRAIESEAHVPFAGLLELLRPVLGLLERIPEPQAEALAGALALRPATAVDRFAVGAATLSLLAAAAEETPVAVLADDVQWLDGASADALLFAARRLVADAIAVVAAVRTGEPSVLDGAGLEVLHVEGLDPEATAAMLRARLGTALAPGLAQRAHRSTGGNPLALMELDDAAPDRVEAPVPVPASLSRAFLRRADALDGRARRALVLAAATDRGELSLIGRAAAAQGLDAADLAAAEAAGLVTLRDGRVEFRHPLVRSAVYAAAPAEQRRAAHRALAGALPDRDADRRAWHLAGASLAPDEGVAAALRAAGERARGRSAYTIAAAAFERGARLAPAPAEQARLLHAAADAAWLAGLADRALALVDEARAAAAEPALATAIDHLRGRVAVRRGRVREGHAILMAAAERAAAAEPERAAGMLAEATNAAFYAGDVDGMARAAGRARELAAGAGPEVTFLTTLAHGMALVFAGEGDAGAGEIRRAVELLERSGELPPDPRLLAWAVMGPLWLREPAAARALADRALQTARRHAAVGVLPYLLMHVARDAAAADRWPAASAAYHEGIRLARDTGQRTDLATLLAGLASVEARQGREPECRAHAAEARAIAAEAEAALPEIWALAALGDLELGLGHAEPALAALEELDARLDALAIGDPDLSPAPELVELRLRLGRTDGALAAADRFEALARAKGRPWALARAARSRGLLAPDAEMDEPFARALALHEQTPDVFAAARTRLAYGARLRRARRRVQAREPLRAALAEFERLGAAPWARAARAELAATGETARRREPGTRDELTPQELQIGLLLADGRTTREAAAALFLSPKTIEYHLRHVYRKLGIGSREELAAALGGPS